MKSENDSGDLTREERLAFDRLDRQKSPPSSILEKTIETLYAKNLINPPATTDYLFAWWTVPRFSAAVIAASILFLMGYVVARWQVQENAMTKTQTRFALLIHDDDDFEGDPRVQGEEYGNWMFTMRDSGRSVTGQGLGDDGRILHAEAGQIQVRNLIAGGTYGAVGGFFIIEADDYAEAVQLASSCPHLKYNGTIEVRKIHF